MADNTPSHPFPTGGAATAEGADGGAGMPATAALQGQGEQLLNRVVQGAHDTIDRLAESAVPHLQRLEETVANTGDLISRQAHQVRETGDEWTDNLRSTVREHPLAALAAAVAVGLLLAKLTS